MNIYHVSAASVPSESANSIQVMRMAAALAGVGHSVTLVCREGLRGEDPYRYYGVGQDFEIVRCGWPQVRGIGSLWYAEQVRRLVDARGLPDAFYGRHLVSLARLSGLGRPIVAEVHAPPPHVFERRLERRLFAAPSFERLIAISQALADEYRRLFPELDRGRLAVAHNAADIPGSSRPAPVDGRAGAPRVGYVGHLYPGKGLEIIRQLAGRMPHVEFHVFGRLGACADRPSGDPHTNLRLHDHVPPCELSGILGAFEIVVAPYNGKVRVSGGTGDDSRWMSPLKLFEYMAHGCAIVASDLPVIRELIEPERTGLLCAPDDIDAWCRSIQRLLDQPELAKRLGAGARDVQRRCFTWRHRAAFIVEGLDCSRRTRDTIAV